MCCNSMSEPIFTLDGRENVMLEVTRKHFKVSPARMRGDIWGMHGKLIEILNAKGIRYGELVAPEKVISKSDPALNGCT